MAVSEFRSHSHQGLVHNHEHIHICHHARGGAEGEIEHLVSVHRHDHNHPPVEHSHLPHENPEREHEHEAHIHDHSHPDQS